MGTIENNGRNYYLPLEVVSGLSPILHIVCIFFVAALFSVPWLLNAPLWVSILCAVLGAVMLGFYLYIAVLHRCQIRLSQESLYFHLPFCTHILRLVEIEKVKVKSAHVCPTVLVTTLLRKNFRLPLFLFCGTDAQLLKTTLETEIARAVAALPEAEENSILEAEDFKYALPFKIHSKLTFGQHALYLFTATAMLFLTLLCLFYLQEIFWLAFLFLPTSAFSFALWLYNGVLQKGSIYGDKQELRIKQFAARERVIPWEKIAMVDFVCVSRYGAMRAGDTHLRIVTFSENNTVNAKQFLLRRNPNLHLVPLAMFATLNRYRFMRTVRDQMDAAAKSANSDNDDTERD